MRKIEFTCAPLYSDRKYYISEQDVRTVLLRLPQEVYQRLRAVHFDDRSWGVRMLGYTTNRGRKEISICALPPRVSLARFLTKGQTPASFGAKIGCRWSEVAVRRFLLYDVLLHELGHLQIVNPNSTNCRRKFASEKKAQEFADFWRKQLWAEYFEHEDPVQNAPKAEELI
jgi:hypothetical protein